MAPLVSRLALDIPHRHLRHHRTQPCLSRSRTLSSRPHPRPLPSLRHQRLPPRLRRRFLRSHARQSRLGQQNHHRHRLRIRPPAPSAQSRLGHAAKRYLHRKRPISIQSLIPKPNPANEPQHIRHRHHILRQIHLNMRNLTAAQIQLVVVKHPR